MRVGILTGGGLAPGTNAVIAGTALQLKRRGEIPLGIPRGWEGMTSKNTLLDFSEWDDESLRRLATEAGTRLRSSREKVSSDNIQIALEEIQRHTLDAIIAIGGDDTLTSANFLQHQGFHAVVGVPKTIDNDVHGTDSTYGHWSAVDIAQRHVEKMFTEADDMKRVAFVEIMGRKAGWLAARGGGGGGANIELIPEVEVPMQRLVERVQALFERQKHVVIAVAEGYLIDGKVTTRSATRDKYGNEELGGVAYHLAEKMKQSLSVKTQVQTPGYDVRSGKPNGFDRNLARALGTVAAEAVHRKLFGVMAAWQQGRVVPVSLTEAKGGRCMPREMYDADLLQTRLLYDGKRPDIEAVFL